MSMIGNVAAASDSEIDTLLASPSNVMKFVTSAAPRMDVDKAWHAMHYLLNGEAWDGTPPLDFWTLGGAPLGELGYGPARAFKSDEVRAIAAALEPIDVAKLFARWDGKKMRKAEIYAVDFDDRAAEEDYVGGNYDSLKRFIAGLARDGRGMIVYVS